MSDKHADILWSENPIYEIEKKNSKKKQNRLSRWFVSNQKTEEWNKNELNQLHVRIVILLIFMYICHIIASPFIKFIGNNTMLVVINIVESLCLIIGILLLIKMCLVNGSWAATKLLFSKGSVDTYIYIFWILRSFVIEILKGQIVYSFVLLFHSVVIYSSDIWYLCNQKTLVTNILLFLLIIIYEFSVSISPVGPDEPSWEFMNIKTTANSLSRSNQFNLFIIFIDAFIVVIYDSKRSKYAMIFRKEKRIMLETPLEGKKKLLKLWKMFFCLNVANTISFVGGTILKLSQSIIDIILAINSVIIMLIYICIVYISSTGHYKILCKLLQERSVIFILILLGILFYIDNIYFNFSAAGIVFPLVILVYLSLDFIGGYFPRKVSLASMVVIVFVLVFNIFNNTFLKTDCEENKLKWGIFGEMISYCTIKRLIYQSILSLLISAALATLSGNTNQLFFCNANIYRSTGTIERTNVDADYVQNMSLEQESPIRSASAFAFFCCSTC